MQYRRNIVKLKLSWSFYFFLGEFKPGLNAFKFLSGRCPLMLVLHTIKYRDLWNIVNISKNYIYVEISDGDKQQIY